MNRIFLVLGIIVLMGPAFGADVSANQLPPWLLGKWTVTKIYEEDKVYSEPSAEPKVWLDSGTLTIAPNRLSLGGEVCTDVDAVKKRGSVAHILAENAGEKPSDIGLVPRKVAVNYLSIRCGRSFTEETSERTGIDYIIWYVVFDPKNEGQIELAFFDGAYLELRRAAPTS